MIKKKLVAAIDVGSHEIHMKIVQIESGKAPQTIETVRRTLAIGADTYNYNSISQSLINDCQEVLSGFAVKLKEYRIKDVRLAATSAFREANNQLFALDQIERASGLKINVLSNNEERYYHILAAAEQIPDFGQTIESGTLILDIGAGSIQATVYNKGEFVFTQNMLLGSLRVREILSDLERQTGKFGSLMAEYISGDLENYQMLEPKGINYSNLVVISGENEYLRRLADVGGNGTETLNKDQVESLYEKLLNSSILTLISDNQLPADHAHLLLPTTIIMRKFLEFTESDKLHLLPTDLCDGLLLEMAHRMVGHQLVHDPALDTISACRHLANRFKIDKNHSKAVEALILSLFSQTSRLHRLPSRYKLLLQAAAILHDIGKYISMARHADRSYRIILASEIIGISSQEQLIIALIARYHSGPIDLTDPILMELEPKTRLIVCKLIALFRIANALDTGHQHKLDRLDIVLDQKKMNILVDAGKEIVLEKWNMEKTGDFFYQVYGLQPRIKLRRQRKNE